MRTLQGTIISNSMAKTVVVRVDNLRKHEKYGKFYRVSRKYKAHAEDSGGFKVGDVVSIRETRPVSKEKRWKVAGVLVRTVAEPVEGE